MVCMTGLGPTCDASPPGGESKACGPSLLSLRTAKAKRDVELSMPEVEASPAHAQALLSAREEDSSDPPARPYVLSRRAYAEASSPNYLLLHTESQKAMFCMIPKNACSEFLALMMRIHGLGPHHWNPSAHGGSLFPNVHFDSSRDVLFFPKTSSGRDDLEGILRGGAPWSKAVFLRDPVDRLMSAYLSKLAPESRVPFMYRRYPADSFEELVGMLEKTPMDRDNWHVHDPHIRPQSYICGLDETIERYSFVGFFDDLEGDARRMVVQMGGAAMADEMLDTGWGPFSNRSLFGTPRKSRESSAGGLLQSTSLFGLELYAGVDVAFSTRNDLPEAGVFWTGTGAEHARLTQLRTQVRASPHLADRIRALYHMDYELIGKARRLRGNTTMAARD